MRTTLMLIRGAGLTGLAAMLLLAGCSDATREPGTGGPEDPGNEPPGLTGDYGLQGPYTAFEGRVPDGQGGEMQLKVVAMDGSLVLTDTTYEHQLRSETYIDGALAGRANWHDRGWWVAQGDTVYFNSNYIGGLHFRGIKNSGTVRVLLDLVGEGTLPEYPYRRRQIN